MKTEMKFKDKFGLGPNESKTIEYTGKGKIIQVAWCTPERHTLFSVNIDGWEHKVNNSFCIEMINNKNSLIQQEEVEIPWIKNNYNNKVFRVVSRFKWDFKEKDIIKLTNEAKEPIMINGFHTYAEMEEK